MKILDKYELITSPGVSSKADKDKYFHEYEEIKKLDYLIIMQRGDRNLDIIHRCEKPNKGRILAYAKDICSGIKVFHEKRRMHGDIKPQNFVRVKNKIQMIDFDACGKIVESNDLKSSFHAGLKFSSGVVPPEMICKMNSVETEQYLTYFKRLEVDDPQLWKKIQPVYDHDEECYYCVKTFLADDDGMIHDVGNLPYKPMKADKAIDLWSFGVLLYKLLSKNSLFDTNKDEDLTYHRCFKELYYWNSQKRDNKLLDIEDERAQDLLQILLSKKSEERKTIESVLKHPYIDSGKPFMKGILKQNEDNVKYLLSKFRDQITTVVCNAMFQATEIKVPTCFIISEKKLDNNKNGNKNGEKNDHFSKECARSLVQREFRNL